MKGQLMTRMNYLAVVAAREGRYTWGQYVMSGEVVIVPYDPE